MENSREYYCLNIIVKISSFSPLNTNASTTLKYYHKQALNKKLKLMGGAMKFFTKKLWFPGLRNIFWKICKTLRSPPSYILNVHSLRWYLTLEELFEISKFFIKYLNNFIPHTCSPSVILVIHFINITQQYYTLLRLTKQITKEEIFI